MYVDSQTGAIAECFVASAVGALKLCQAGGIGYYDIAFTLRAKYETIGGQGYGCDLVIHKNLDIGNAICK